MPTTTKALLGGAVGLNLALAGSTVASLQALTRLEKETSTDALTGLHTKAFILQHGNEVVENLRKANPSHDIYAFHMDLNGLKLMNDYMSKYHGDKLLQLLETVVVEKTTPTQTALFRYGSSGDEFELFLSAKDQADAAKKMKAIQQNMLRQTHEWPEITHHLKREGDRIGKTYNSLQDYIVYQEYLKARELMQSPPRWDDFRKTAVAKMDDRIRKPLGLTVAGMKLADSIESGKPHKPLDLKAVQEMQPRRVWMTFTPNTTTLPQRTAMNLCLAWCLNPEAPHVKPKRWKIMGLSRNSLSGIMQQPW
jgi:diguanylate cyclase (GGDEF)-like protein